MPARPMSVSVVAWILIVFALFGLFSMLILLAISGSPLMQASLARVHAPLPVQISFGTFGSLVQLLCGIALLFRQNWARFLYTGWAVIGLAYSVITSPYTLWLIVPSLIYTLVIVYFLFTPAAKQYFTGANTATAAG